MQKNALVLGVVAVVVVVVGVGVAAKYGAKNEVSMEADKQVMMEKDAMQQDDKNSAMDKKDDAMMQGDQATGGDTMMKKDDAMMQKTQGTYLEYSPQVLAAAEEAQKSGRRVVLFFHANWCPFCRAADKDFKAILGTNEFPENVTVIKTDYDTETELKRKYGVTTQHTFVQIDANGGQITKWIGGEVAELAKNIK